MINIIFDKKNSTQLIPNILNKFISDKNIINIQTFKQSKGVGRYNRKWHSPRGNLYFSLYFKNKINSIPYINAYVCYLIHSYFRDILNINLSYKWPNDLFYNNKKIVGILSQNEITGNDCLYKIGIGININRPILYKNINSITLSEINGKEINILDFSNDIQIYVNRYILRKYNQNKIVNYLDKYLLLNKTNYRLSVRQNMIKNIQIISLNKDLSLKIIYNNLYRDIYYGELS